MSSLLAVPLTRRVHRVPVVPLLHGKLAERAWSWDWHDQWTREWWPQGITWAGERLLVSWYAKSGGSRVSVVDLDSRHYAHVTLLTPAGEPLKIHAGGLAWIDGWLYVAATGKGFWTLHYSDVSDGRAARSASDERRRDPATTTHLYAGEYGRGKKSTRLWRLPVDDGQPAGPVELLATGPKGMQGVTATADGLIASTSHGPWTRGSLHRLSDGDAKDGRAARSASDERPSRPRNHVAPVGVEDLTSDSSGHLWTPAEHPGRRAIVQLRQP